MFVWMMKVAQKARGPLDHMYFFLLKKQKPGDISRLAKLTFFKAKEIANEFRELLDVEKWLTETGHEDLPLDTYEERGRFAKSLCWRNFADFQRRVLDPMGKMPLRLLLLAKLAPGEVCSERKDLCADMISMDERDMHITALKIRTLFRPIIESCARDGMLCTTLWVPIRIVCEKLTGSSQDMEMLNKLIKNGCKQAPNISLGLLDARVGVRRELRLGSRSDKDLKWSDIDPRAKV